jgi:hypothetical protein
MTDPRDELVEAAARAMWKTDEPSQWELGMARAAIAVALEEAAKLAEAKCDEWATVWRNGLKCDSHMEGKSDGADDIAAAIRALKENSNDRHS